MTERERTYRTDGGKDHDHHAHDVADVGVAVLTVSSSRDLDHDPSGEAIVAAIEKSPHHVVTRDLVPDDYDAIQTVLASYIDRTDAGAVISTGGTGVSPEDVTVEAATPLIEKRLPGFGEFFRQRSAEEIGTQAMATRTTAGVSDGTVLACLPGSRSAAVLGVDLLLSELGHLVGLAGQSE